MGYKIDIMSSFPVFIRWKFLNFKLSKRLEGVGVELDNTQSKVLDH